MTTYQLLDCGNQKKLEKFGDYTLIRPCPQALWQPVKPEIWSSADAEFIRTSSEKGEWTALSKRTLPESWTITSENNLQWQIQPNDFGNLGVFTEHWNYAEKLAKTFTQDGKILDLFSYSGSNAMALIRHGFSVTAVDSSKNAMDSYTANMNLNDFPRAGQRLILEDVSKFLAREIRREAKYDGIMMDAPSYGRGTKGEVFKIEDDLVELLLACKQLLAVDGKLVFTLHSPRFTPASLQILTSQLFPDRAVESTEIIQECESGISLPSGFLVQVF